MNGASKILTVSYGTFSCTLEGFDDPFNTMKAIAEYFRDLAAEDRYFGAEPPTPDAAMLHRIAEREIQRRVEAKIQENGVVLRASDADAEPAVAAPVAAPAAMPSVAPAAVAASVASPVAAPVVAEAAPEPAAAPAPAVIEEAAPAAESVVEKLSRLRSEIAAQPAVIAPAQTSPIVSFAIPDYVEDLETDTIDAGVAQALSDFLPEDEAAVEADLPEEMAVDAAVEEFAEETMETVEAAAEDLSLDSLDLSGVLEEVAVEEPAPVAEEAFVEAEEAAVEADVDLSDSLRAVLDASEADEVLPEASAEDAELVADVADWDTREEETAIETRLWPEQDEEAVADVSADGDDSLMASLGAVLEGQDEAEDSAERAEVAPARSEEDISDAEIVSEEEAPVAETDATAEEASEPETLPSTLPVPRASAAEKLMRARARVVRIRRGDTAPTATDAIEAKAVEIAARPVEPETASPAQEVAPVEVPEAKAPVAVDRTEIDAVQAKVAASMAEGHQPILSEEDEAALQRELAALMQNDEDAKAQPVEAVDLPGEARRGFEGPSADEALSRLMQQTDSEMSGTETKRRQSAIAHLKAAVAATVADRKVVGEKSGETETVSRLARYRNDLAMAVKAALPGRGGAAAPQGERPAPLVLVSEQRIDRPRNPVPPPPPAPAAPIRPRRVAGASLGMATAAELGPQDEEEDEEDVANLFGDTRGFADFVERVGASSFEQILEASAAYLAGVEGRPHFSRPQLMQHLTAVIPQGSFQREDGLRSFGTLLREGRIAKVRRGQFTVSEDSRYLAEARKIAG